VVFPGHIGADLKTHLADFVAPEADALVFTSPTGTPLRHNNFRRRVWLPALAEAGLNELHFHDLRHTGNDLTAATGATLREMMDRMGHSSPRAALIYMHGNDGRQRKIADSLNRLAQSELSRNGQRPKDSPRRKPSGTQRARNGVGGS
jgi:integrase